MSISVVRIINPIDDKKIKYINDNLYRIRISKEIVNNNIVCNYRYLSKRELIGY